jgi:putative FmdB family regulatory protein
MPIYTYRCSKCKEKVEKMRDIDRRDDKAYCNNGHEATRQIDSPGLVWAPTAGGMR